MERVNVQPIYANYKREKKWLGLIDYKSLIALVVYSIVVINILRIIPFQTKNLIYMFMFLIIPVIAIVIVNINNESIVDVLFTMLSFYLRSGIYVKLEFVRGFKKEIYINYAKKENNIYNEKRIKKYFKDIF